MKYRFDVAARTALAISLAAIAGTAFAVPGYVTDGSGHAVLSGSGTCWKTGEWTPDKAREPCDVVPRAATPAPVAQAERAEPPPPVAAAPVEQPAPPVIQKLTLSTDVLFAFNKAELQPGGQQKLDELAARAKGADVDRVQAEGKGESDPVTGDQCKNMGRESARNAKLVACLQPDRRVDVELLGSREVASGSASTAGTSSGGSS